MDRLTREYLAEVFTEVLHLVENNKIESSLHQFMCHGVSMLYYDEDKYGEIKTDDTYVCDEEQWVMEYLYSQKPNKNQYKSIYKNKYFSGGFVWFEVDDGFNYRSVVEAFNKLRVRFLRQLITKLKKHA